MSRPVFFAVPGDLRRKSGGSAYDRRIITELKNWGWTVRHLPLASGFPNPSTAERVETEKTFAAIPDGSSVIVDGLAFGAMPEIAKHEANRLHLIALVHHPLARETGLEPGMSERFLRSERAALGVACNVVVTSDATARDLRENYGVDDERIVVAVPGTDPASMAIGSGADALAILSVGSITARKDYATFVTALSLLVDCDWTCRIVGDDRVDPETTRDLERRIDRAGLSDRVTLVGPVDDVAAEYMQADIFALASRYEGYGMVFAEAMARGLPIVACRGGAIPDVVPETAGRLVEPCDVTGFAAALRLLIEDRTTRRSCASASREAGLRLPTWRQSAERISRMLKATQVEPKALGQKSAIA